jgi:CubicO group peptidase (beta-lactamase class C family)
VTAAALVMIFALAPVDTTGDGLVRARLNDYIDRLDAFGFAGQVMLEQKGRVLLDRSVGLADRRFGVRVTPGTIFGLGSITKTFTAAAILRLASQGKVALDDPLSRRLPGVPPDKRDITLDQLLSHRGGLLLDADLPDEASRDEVVRRILAQPLGSAPGERFSYSNIGFDLLAAVVERASGTDYDTFVRREFLVPAGMAHTGRAGVRALAAFPAARGENEWDEATALREWPPAWHGTGAGRMVSNAPDLARWAHALSDGVVLTPKERDLMFAPHATRPDGAGYGYGMQLATLPGGAPLVFHGGDVPGYRSEMRMEPAAGRIIAVVTNQDRFELGVQRRVISNTLARLADGASPDLPPPAVIPANASLSEALGTWRLASGARIEITEKDGRLRLTASGQDAVDLFEPDPLDTARVRGEATRRTRALVDAAIAGDTTAARALLPPEEVDLGWAFLARGIAALARFGPIDSVESLGTLALPFAGRGLRSYFRLHLAQGTRGGYLAWNQGRLEDVTLGEARPAPVLLPVAPLAGGGFAAFDLLRTRAVAMRVVPGPGGAPELRIDQPGGEVVAIRAP